MLGYTVSQEDMMYYRSYSRCKIRPNCRSSITTERDATHQSLSQLVPTSNIHYSLSTDLGMETQEASSLNQNVTWEDPMDKPRDPDQEGEWKGQCLEHRHYYRHIHMYNCRGCCFPELQKYCKKN